jgi:hypothetical protein
VAWASSGMSLRVGDDPRIAQLALWSKSGWNNAPIKRFIITIEGPGWTDFQDIELPRLPGEGELLETKFGTLPVARAEETPDMHAYAGRIVCRVSEPTRSTDPT